MRPLRPAALLAALLSAPADAATWQLAAGPTRYEGGALEVSRATRRWETAFGYVSSQQVDVTVAQDTCAAGPTGPACTTNTWSERRPVDGYGYLSLQRRFEFRRHGVLQPLAGAGFVVNSDTNPYVSSAVTFSLSAGLRLGPRWTLEWRHFSNAGLAQPNLGQDLLLIRSDFGGD